MDHRCLYGHRVASTFRFAIDNDACPICGAELVSVEGYKLARVLAEAVPLDGVAAFRTARVLLRRFTLTPVAGATTDAASTTPEVPAGTEVQLDEEDLVADHPSLDEAAEDAVGDAVGDVVNGAAADRAAAAADDSAAGEEVLLMDLDDDDDPAAADNNDATVVAPTPGRRAKSPGIGQEDGFSDVDEAFFAEGSPQTGA